MHRCAEVSEAIEELASVNYSLEKHKEMLPGRIQKDSNDFNKIFKWFQSHNPFNCHEKLMCLDSGLVDEYNDISCDYAEEIGASIQQNIDGKTFTNCSFKKKGRITNLQSLYSSVSVDKEDISINPLTRFNVY